MTDKPTSKIRKAKTLKDHDLDEAKGGAAKPLTKSSLDVQGATKTQIHGSDFNA